jgi:hypothetical protein
MVTRDSVMDRKVIVGQIERFEQSRSADRHAHVMTIAGTAQLLIRGVTRTIIKPSPQHN